MAKDLRKIYEAGTEEEGAAALDEFAEKWDKRYPHVEEASKKWTFRQRDWAMIYSQLMIYFGDRMGGQA